MYQDVLDETNQVNYFLISVFQSKKNSNILDVETNGT